MEQNQQFLNTKLIFPTLPANLVPRTNLIRRLNDAQTAKLISIYAPAGYGKSTLVNYWLKSVLKKNKNKARGCWFTIEQQDDDPALFFSYLIRSLQRIDSNIGQWAHSLINFPQVSYESIVTLLINDITACAYRCYIVLDDYQYVTNGLIHHWLTYLVDHLPPNAQIIITSRETPPLPLYRLRIYGSLIELNSEDLRFTLAETKTFLKDFMGLLLNDKNIEIIQKHTEGWVAGLQIAALSIKGKLKSGVQKLDIISRLFDQNDLTQNYFYQEVLNQQKKEIQNFYLKTCVFERFSAPLCDELLGIRNSREILEQLSMSNSFLVSLDDHGEWYRYHSLFTNFLLSQLSEDEICDLQIQASRWHEKDGSLIDAIKYAFAADDQYSAGRMLVEIAPELISKGELPLLTSWLRILPDEVILEHVYLATITGWMKYHMGKGNQADMYLKSAEGKLSGELSPLHHLSHLLVSVEILNSKGKLTAALQNANKAFEINRQLVLDDCSLNEIYSETLRLNGEYNDAIKSFNLTIQKCREHNNQLMEAFSIFHLANTLYQQGEYSFAIALCEEFINRQANPAGDLNPLAGYGLIPLAQIYYETNHLHQAEEYLAQGVRLVQEIGMLKPLIRGSLLKAKLHFLNDDLENTHKALFYAQEMSESLNHVEYRLLVAAEGAELELRMRNLGACERWLKSVHADLVDYHKPLYEQLGLTYARFLIVNHSYQKANTILQMLEEKALRQFSIERLIKIYILRTRNDYFGGQFPQAFQYLENAVKYAMPIRAARSFLDQEIDLAPLLSVIQNDNSPFVDLLIDEFSSRPGSCLESPGISSMFLDHFNERECEIIRLVMDKLTNKEIANHLYITVGTIKWYLNKIYKKMGVKNREEVIDLINSLPIKAADIR